MSNQVIMAAGCMLHQLPKLLDHFGAIDQARIRLLFGPSGSLRAKIDNGESCSLFISAISRHTDALAKTGKLLEASVLGLNPTVLVCHRDLEITTETVHQFLSDPKWTLAVSTTGLDPDADEIAILKKSSKNFGFKLSTVDRPYTLDHGWPRNSKCSNREEPIRLDHGDAGFRPFTDVSLKCHRGCRRQSRPKTNPGAAFNWGDGSFWNRDLNRS
jgi:hypothetical protein